MKRLHSLGFSLVLAAFLAACASIGLEKAESFGDRLAYAYGIESAVYTAAAQSYRAGEIDDKDKQDILDAGDVAHKALEAAQLAYEAGDLKTAEARLNAAVLLLTRVQESLRSKAAAAAARGAK